MQSIVAFLAVLVGVAIANPMVISSDDVNQQNRDISATEYLRRIFQNSAMHYDNLIDMSSQDDHLGDLVATLPALGLREASFIAKQVDLRMILVDSDFFIITVNGALVIDADRIIGNTMLHVVDKVIYPLPVDNIVQTLVDVEAFSVIVDLLKHAGLAEVLADADPITVLVPTNAAFQALPSGVLEDLQRNKTKLQNLLKYHVISDVRYSASLSSGQHITALQGDEISVSIENGRVLLNQERDQSAASVIQADIPTTNGVVHVIDHVLLPSHKHYLLV